MKSKRRWTIGIFAGVLAAMGGTAILAQDKYSVKVPGGLAFSEFRGYEAWQTIAISRNDKVMAVTRAYSRDFNQVVANARTVIDLLRNNAGIVSDSRESWLALGNREGFKRQF